MGGSILFKTLRLYSTLWIRRKARVVVRGTDEIPPRQAGERRVYILVNRSTSLDIAALMHVSLSPFAILAGRDDACLPLVRRLLHGARFIPLGNEGNGDNWHTDSDACIAASLRAIESGMPLIVSLHDDPPGAGRRGRIRTEGLRIARKAGARIYPLFLKAEESGIRSKAVRGPDGVERVYTTLKNSIFFIEALKPMALDDLPSDAGEEAYQGLARRLETMSDAVEARYEAYLEDNRERFAPLKRRGGARLRVAW